MHAPLTGGGVPLTPECVNNTDPRDIATWLGLHLNAAGLMSWDVFDAVLTPGDVILLPSWRDQDAAEAFEATESLHDDLRMRRGRVVRDYGLFDRRESPQYYPDVERPR
ncbi:MAG: hypothetical protein ACRDSH_13075 [Pseudonocardiaceae bacterium]